MKSRKSRVGILTLEIFLPMVFLIKFTKYLPKLFLVTNQDILVITMHCNPIATINVHISPLYGTAVQQSVNLWPMNIKNLISRHKTPHAPHRKLITIKYKHSNERASNWLTLRKHKAQTCSTIYHAIWCCELVICWGISLTTQLPSTIKGIYWLIRWFWSRAVFCAVVVKLKSKETH